MLAERSDALSLSKRRSPDFYFKQLNLLAAQCIRQAIAKQITKIDDPTKKIDGKVLKTTKLVL
ncbi:MAG: hypothetical protein DCE90_02090 [Pseudanabaena sp.]|nr:MAG: hypothetical protein DCE90_02090 [Pseudanabaena sp.]